MKTDIMIKKEPTTVALLENIPSFMEVHTLTSIVTVSPPEQSHIGFRDCYFFKLSEVSYDDEYPRREAFENVLSTLDNSAFNFVYLISGKPSGVEIFLGIVRNYKSTVDSPLSASDYAIDLLKASLVGNFQGSQLERLTRENITRQLFDVLQQSRRTSVITGIPSVNQDEQKSNIDFQGIDRLINSMAGATWQFMVVCEPVEQQEIAEVKSDVYRLYNELHRQEKMSLQQSRSFGSSTSKTQGTNESRSKTIGTSESKGSSRSENNSYSSSGTSENRGTSRSTAENKGSNWSTTRGENEGTSNALTIEVVDKQISEVLAYINDELLERIKLGNGKGLFKTAMYALAPDYATHERLQRSIMSIFQGNSSSFSPLRSYSFPEDISAEEVGKILCHFQVNETAWKQNNSLPLLFGHPVQAGSMGLCSYMTAREVSLIAGLPTKEVPGLALREGVEFGLNIEKTEDGVELGHLVYRGRHLAENRVHINKEHLNKHVFVAGVTGSGKTTTCQRLLLESNLPFLVIEPAKTEYRALYGKEKMKDLHFFTLGNEKLAPFRFNPFELLPSESLTSHIDMLKATFSAVFPMEAAMPQILEMAIYEMYEGYGWDINTDTNRYCENPWEENGLYWPTFSDLLKSLEKVIKAQGFGRELQANYTGALLSRISNLTIGAKGQMLNCKQSIDFMSLLDQKVVFEMDDLRAPEDKALMIGFILSRLAEALKARHMVDSAFRHVTLVEEAHRLLPKAEPGEGGAKKLAVEMFADMLAEVRKYGEGLIIVDQIPNKLAPDVLKNTNTKIIHKLFAHDDKQAVGDTMALDDKQKEFLSRLSPGGAVVFSQNWHQAIHVQVKQQTNTIGKPLSTEAMRAIGQQQLHMYQGLHFPELKKSGVMLEQDELEIYIKKKREVRSEWVSLASKPRADYQSYSTLEHLYKELCEGLPRIPADQIDIALAYDILISRGNRHINSTKEYSLEQLTVFVSMIRQGKEDRMQELLKNEDTSDIII